MKMKLSYTLCVLVFLLYACNSTKKPTPVISFHSCKTQVDASLRGLHVVNKNVIWVSGSGGTVLRSINGGETWNSNVVPGAASNDFRSIHAWDEKRAMVFGVAGPEFGYCTEDGGESWKVIFRDSTEGLFFNSLKFADDKNGLAVSDPVDGKFFVLRTQDGGNSWEQVLDVPDVVEGEANFAASNTCIEFLPDGHAWIASGGNDARVFCSCDYGKTWEVAKTPMIRGQASSGIFSITFKSNMVGVIVGGIYDQPELNKNISAYTIDGGKNWLPSGSMPKEYRSCVQQVGDENQSILFAIGKTGCDFSADNGINWKFLCETGFYTFRAVPGSLSGFVAGAEGKISKVNFVLK